MIDFVNLSVYKLLLEKWLENPVLRENGFADIVVNEDTGELKSRCNSEYNGLIFKLIPSSKIAKEYVKIISGSLHKYFNNGEHNYNRFTHNDCVRIINELSEKFDISPTDAVLHGLEFGVNLYLPYSPQKVIKSVIVHGNKPYEAINKDRRNGVICVRSEYSIKIYDKGITSKKFKENILRIEYKVTDMTHLEKFGIKLLSDLLNIQKVNSLLDLLVCALENTIFIPLNTEIEGLTDHEKINFHAMGKPLFWKELTRKQRHDKRLTLTRILEKCNAFCYKIELINRLKKEWDLLILMPSEASKTVTFSTILQDSEAVKTVTFSTLEYQSKTLRNPLEIEKTENEVKTTSAPLNERVCKTCGKPINQNRKESLFCSIKFNPLAKRCRNKDSNQRRTFKAQIMKAKETGKWLNVHYRNLEDVSQEVETVILHSSEITVSRGWLNTIVKIEILHEDPNLYKCPNEATPEILTGVDAKNFAGRLSRENTDNSHIEKLVPV